MESKFQRHSYNFKLFFTFILFGILLLAISFYANKYMFEREVDNFTKYDGLDKLVEIERKFQNRLSHYKEVLNSIKDSETFKNFLNKRESSKESLEDILLTIAKFDRNLMQVRFLNLKGDELLKIERATKVKISKNLQNRASRYYFREALKLKKGDFFFSNIDLNIEHSKVEKPMKPTLRVATPIFLDRERVGVLIINIFMESILNSLKSFSFYDLYIVDRYGNFIIHKDSRYNFSIYKNLDRYNLSDEFPKSYRTILESYQFSNSQIFSKKLNFQNSDGIILILKRKVNTFEQYLIKYRHNILIILSIIMLLAVPLSYIFSFVPRQLSRELEYKRNLYSLMLDNLPLMVIYKDCENRIIDANYKALEFLKLDFIDESTPLSLYDIFCKDLADRLYRDDLEVIASSKKRVTTQELTFKDKNFIMIDSKFPVVKNSKVIGILNIIEDITEQEMLKRESKKHEELLIQQSKMAEVGNIVNMITHQLKQPLLAQTLMIDNIEYLIESDSKKEAFEYLEKLITQINFMSDTIENFKDFLKPSKDIVKFSISKAIESIIALLSFQLKGDNIEIELKRDEELDDEIISFENEFKQVILNIISNSRDAIVSEKIESGKIVVSISKAKECFMVEISDNGLGVPESILKDIFKPYFSTKGFNGSGIGLYMSKIIIESKMSGEISVENYNYGAVFKIKIPLK